VVGRKRVNNRSKNQDKAKGKRINLLKGEKKASKVGYGGAAKKNMGRWKEYHLFKGKGVGFKRRRGGTFH